MIYNFIDISKPLEFNSIGKFQDNSPDYMHADRPLSNFELIVMTKGALYLKKACDYIRKNLTEELRIPEIARYAGINKSYLQSLFSRQMHCTITDYINRKRLEQAAFLLINSSLTITDIAFHTGYNSRQHFAATFEKYYGSGPRAYRQLHGKQLETTTGKERFSEKDGIWNSKPL